MQCHNLNHLLPIAKKNQHIWSNDYHFKFCPLAIYSDCRTTANKQEGKKHGVILAGRRRANLFPNLHF